MHNNYDIKSIQSGLDELLRTIPSSMQLLRDELAKSKMRLSEPMQLAVIGRISSSKSTLINAILGKDNVMATGQMEVTYNVGWLKHGKPNSEIIIHHKDNSTNSHKNPEEFLRWSIDGGAGKEDLNNVSYIETFDDAEILRDINIIDTPGLDAERGQDSLNTLNFLKNVRPDAVIMLFTHSVAEKTLEVVKEFNGGGDFNPLNAVGVLAKIDVLWMESIGDDRSALEIGKALAAKKMNNTPALRKTLFDISPISSLLFLKASTITEEELQCVKLLVLNDSDMLEVLLMSASDFIDPDYEVSLSVEQRKALLSSLDLYAIHLIAKAIEQNNETTLSQVRELLHRESGAKDFTAILHNHFGSRSKLIKIESIYHSLSKALRAQKNELIKYNLPYDSIERIEQKIAELFSSLVFEHNEYELLNRIYSGALLLDDEVKEEIFALCGESGHSAFERLGITDSKASIEDLIAKVTAREAYWRKTINTEFDPDEKEWMKVVLLSYNHLKAKIQTMNYQYNQARAFLYNN